MSKPPEFPGSRRLKRAAARAGGGAYEGAFEAVGAILIATGLGYWFDQHYETTPIGVIVGACVGFGAFVLRLFQLGKQLHPDGSGGEQERDETAPDEEDPERGPGEAPGLSPVLRESAGPREETDDESEASEERK